MNNNYTNIEETNNKKGNKLISFIKKHKTKIIIGGTVIAVGITAYVLKDSDVPEMLQNFLENYKAKQDDNYTATSFSEYYNNSYCENEDTLLSSDIENDLEITTEIEKQTIEVRQFIRRMSDNCYASAEKIAEAEQLGISLNDHETIVDPYTREVAA
jgi:hypothetical protein